MNYNAILRQALLKQLNSWYNASEERWQENLEDKTTRMRVG